MASGDTFGPSIGPWNVEQAILALLQTPPVKGGAPLLTYYLADQERSLGLVPRTIPPPPGPSSFRGGVDSLTLQAEWFPMVHVNVQPRDVDRVDMGTQQIGWEVTLTATAGDDDEDVARRVAEVYGTALALLILQHGDLGIGATNTTLTRAPGPELLTSDESPQTCRTTVQFDTVTIPALTWPGPDNWPTDPYQVPGADPTVEHVQVTVVAEPID